MLLIILIWHSCLTRPTTKKCSLLAILTSLIDIKRHTKSRWSEKWNFLLLHFFLPLKRYSNRSGCLEARAGEDEHKLRLQTIKLLHAWRPYFSGSIALCLHSPFREPQLHIVLSLSTGKNSMNGNGNEQTAKKFKIFLAAFFYILSQIEKKSARPRRSKKWSNFVGRFVYFFLLSSRAESIVCTCAQFCLIKKKCNGIVRD